MSFSENKYECRRVQLLNHLGEKFDKKLCN